MLTIKTIGLIGGMSWESSIEYYRIMNEAVRARLGGLHSAKCIMHSVDFEKIHRLQNEGDWPGLTEIMVNAARGLKNAGADIVLICTNTMHIMADDVQEQADIEVLHIADATGRAVSEQGLKKIGLLGTKFTMEKGFYKDRLAKNYGIEAVIPDDEERDAVHHIIFGELCAGTISPGSREKLKTIIDRLASRGAQGVVLGCTELPLIISQKDASIPVFDTTHIHAMAAVKRALSP